MTVAKEFYSHGEIRFTVKQVLWLIQHLGSLREGVWPPDYIKVMGRGNGPRRAPFETSGYYAAEIETRLEKCGKDGLILEAIDSWGKTTDSMASYFRMPVWSVWKRRKKALGYVASGPGRRWLTTPKRKGEPYDDHKRRK